MRPIYPYQGRAQADCEAPWEAALAGRSMEGLHAARFESAGLGGLIDWPDSDPTLRAVILGARRPPWTSYEDSRRAALAAVFALLVDPGRVVLDEMARHRVRVLFTDAPAISDDPQARLLTQVQGVIAEYERAKLAERYRRGKLYRSRLGEVIAWETTYGYRRIARGAAGLAHLEAAGRVHRGNSKGSPRRTEPGAWALRGLVICGCCGVGTSCHKMRGRNGTFHRYYYCHNHDPVRAGGEARRCRERNIRADALDAIVFEKIRETLLRPQATTARRRPLAVEVGVLQERVERLRAENESLRARRGRIHPRRRPHYRPWERLANRAHRCSTCA